MGRRRGLAQGRHRPDRAAAHALGAAGWLARVAVTGVWAYQGVWCKVLNRRPDHRAIVAAVPGIGARRAEALTVLIGAAEAVLALWVASGRAPVRAAASQTVLLAGMNAGGLAFAADRIPHARQMLTRNALLLGLIWALPALHGRS